MSGGDGVERPSGEEVNESPSDAGDGLGSVGGAEGFAVYTRRSGDAVAEPKRASPPQNASDGSGRGESVSASLSSAADRSAAVPALAAPARADAA